MKLTFHEAIKLRNKTLLKIEQTARRAFYRLDTTDHPIMDKLFIKWENEINKLKKKHKVTGEWPYDFGDVIA